MKIKDVTYKNVFRIFGGNSAYDEIDAEVGKQADYGTIITLEETIHSLIDHFTRDIEWSINEDRRNDIQNRLKIRNK